MKRERKRNPRIVIVSKEREKGKQGMKREKERWRMSDGFFFYYSLARTKASLGLARVFSNVKIVGQNIETNALIFFELITIYLLKY